MSGPKSGNWCVIQMPEAEARASREFAMQQLQYYLECILSFQEKLARLQKEHPEFQIHYEVDHIIRPSSEDVGQIVAELNNRYEIYIRLRDDVSRAENILKMQLKLAELVNNRAQLNAAKQQFQDHSKDHRLKEIFDKAKLVISSIHHHTPAERRYEIEDAYKRCLESDDENLAELLLTDLRVRIRKANHETQAIIQLEAERQAKDVHEARELLCQLENNYPSIANQFYSQLKPVLNGDARLTNEIRNSIASTIEVAEREYAGRALRGTLEELGYEVQEGFETIFYGGEPSYFQKSSWDEHHIRVLADSKTKRLSLIPARYETDGVSQEEQVLRDKEMEETWCTELNGVLENLNKKGIQIEITRSFSPGERAMEIVSNQKVEKNRSKRKRDPIKQPIKAIIKQ